MFTSIWRQWLSSSWRSRQASSRGRGRARPRARCRPSIERLEDRTVPTTVTVTTQGQLISAISAANAAHGGVILLGANITLSETTPDNTNDGPNGLPQITSGDNLTIGGNGFTIQRSTSAGNADFRLFDIATGGDLNLTDVTLENGLVAGSPEVTTVQGGAIFVENGGRLYLDVVNLTDNGVTFQGGTAALNFGDTELDVQGGAIYNAGFTNAVGSNFTNNYASFFEIWAPGNGDQVGDNDTDSNDGTGQGNGLTGNVVVEGGAVYTSGLADSGGGATFVNSTFSDNRATSYVQNGSFTPAGNMGNGDSNGDNDGGSHDGNVNGDGVVGNITVEGGGVYNVGTAEFFSVTLSGNIATSEVYNGSYNGNNNGANDNGGIGNGGDNGDGVFGNITVSGGAIYNNLVLSASGTMLTGNNADSTVVNGNQNGTGNGDDGTSDNNGGGNGDAVAGDILVAGGAIENDSAGIVEYLSQCQLSGNYASSFVTNGNDDGQDDGVSNAVGVTGDGKNNGNAVRGSLEVAGGAIDNEQGGTVTFNSGSVSGSYASSRVTNGNTNGIGCGNEDGEGDGISDGVTVEGGGIRNAGTLNITFVRLSSNTAQSFVTNGNVDGNSNGVDDSQSEEGRENGNGVSGNVFVFGGAIDNGTGGNLNVTSCRLVRNTATSSIINGSSDGQSDGQGDGSNNDCGIDCGNGVGADGGSTVAVDGGALDNAGTATVTSSMIDRNAASSYIAIGTNDGIGSGSGSSGTDGQGDGDGLDGNLEVRGGGTANFGTLKLVSDYVLFNSVSSNTPSPGPGNLALDGQLVNGSVLVAGGNRYLQAEGNALATDIVSSSLANERN